MLKRSLKPAQPAESTKEKSSHIIQTQTRQISPPPAYSASAEQEAPPNITAAFSNLKLPGPFDPAPTPTADECLAHLKLLEALHSLRGEVCQRDGLFGIRDDFSLAYNDNERIQVLEKIKEKRWQVYVTKATKRFEAWWFKSVSPEAQQLTQYSVATQPRAQWVGKPLGFEKQDLPPLDVLMVWHAYQLNPRNFLDDCIREGKIDAWRTGLPWALINACIDNDSFEYSTSPEAEANFSNRTKNSWDSFEDSSSYRLVCPKCLHPHEVAWTGWDDSAAWHKSKTNDFDGDAIASGYADKEFFFVCNGKRMTHDTLRASKFWRNCKTLNQDDVPMQGTCLDSNGMPSSTSKVTEVIQFFPNRLIKSAPGDQVLSTAKTNTSKNETMASIRKQIEQALANTSYVAVVNFHKAYREEKLFIRRMMSCYWENASRFSLDLVGAVIRQGTFITKMHRINWLHSPSASYTMTRLLTKYDRYLTIVQKGGGKKIAVPTLDVDLAWHTHQLCPLMYYKHTTTRLGRFLNHDDKIADTVLSTAFEWTSKTYQALYGELYSECTCWYCESIRESHAPKLHKLAATLNIGNATLLEKQLSQLHSARDPDAEMNHLSAHNSIRPDTGSERVIRERNLKIKLERDYKRSVIKARKRGREPILREEYYVTHGSLVVVPYAPEPCETGMYAADPTCASFVDGASGNCAEGTCGGGVAAGACGGSGGCAGGDAGGCSGGGDGGGDGGGGCGGGCGGCG